MLSLIVVSTVNESANTVGVVAKRTNRMKGTISFFICCHCGV